MRMQVVGENPNRQLKIVRMLTSRTEVEDNYRYKGFHLCIAVAEDCGRTDRKHLVKFFILNDDDKEKANARFALECEMKFQARHPYVVYVERLEEMVLLSEEEDKTQTDLLWIYEEMMAQSVSSLPVLCLMEEYADGQELYDYYYEESGEISDEQMFRNMYQLLKGMCGYYGRYRKDPLLHRDIKPSNILIRDSDHSAVYIDFDLSHSSGSTKTQTGKRMLGGTPGYADPRQYEMVIRKSDIRMDIYALGMVFLFMMTGNHYVQTCGQFTDEDMVKWKYLEQENGCEYLYHVKKEKLIRKGKPVFQDKKYEELLRIIERMIHENLNAAQEGEICRYSDPYEIISDFKPFIVALYGNDADAILQENRILTAESVQRWKNTDDVNYVQMYSFNGYSRILTLKRDQVVKVNPDPDCIVILNSTEEGIHYLVSVKNSVHGFHVFQRDELLTQKGYEFTINSNRYRIRKIPV